MKNKGFTLIELLLVAALVAGISIAVANAFANGLKLWKKADELTRQTQSGVFFQQLSQDLRQAVQIKTIPFKGSVDQIEIPTFVTRIAGAIDDLGQERLVQQIGAVRYRYDAARQVIVRSTASYGEFFNRQFTSEIVVCSHVKQADFSYIISAEKGTKMIDRIDNQVPIAVNVKIVLEEARESVELARYCPIPIGGAL